MFYHYIFCFKNNFNPFYISQTNIASKVIKKYYKKKFLVNIEEIMNNKRKILIQLERYITVLDSNTRKRSKAKTERKNKSRELMNTKKILRD